MQNLFTEIERISRPRVFSFSCPEIIRVDTGLVRIASLLGVPHGSYKNHALPALGHGGLYCHRLRAVVVFQIFKFFGQIKQFLIKI